MDSCPSSWEQTSAHRGHEDSFEQRSTLRSFPQAILTVWLTRCQSNKHENKATSRAVKLKSKQTHVFLIEKILWVTSLPITGLVTEMVGPPWGHHEPITFWNLGKRHLLVTWLTCFDWQKWGKPIKWPPYAILTATSFVKNAKKDPCALPHALKLTGQVGNNFWHIIRCTKLVVHLLNSIQTWLFPHHMPLGRH